MCPATLRACLLEGNTGGMNSAYFCLADLAETEFRGESYNGRSLMQSLSQLDARAAAAESSFEGYSAWSVALHVGWCTWVVVKSLLGPEERAILGSWPWPEGEGGFVRLADQGVASWQGTLEALVRVHEASLAAIRTAPEAAFEGRVEEWDIPVAKAVAWLGCHYSYHNAQIRNMGVPGLGPAQRVY